MSNIVTMSQTVGDLTSGQAYRVRSREAEKLLANTQATLSASRGAKGEVLPSKTGKKGL